MATELYLENVKNAFDLSPKSVVYFTVINQRKKQEKLKSDALAARLAQADSKDFQKFLDT